MSSHALAAILEGADVVEFVYLPTWTSQSGLLWGYVRFAGPTTWMTLAAPYLVDVLTFALFFAICLRFSRLPHWLWLNLVILGLLSPLVNTVYAYQGSFYRPLNDVARLLAQLPPLWVHAFFSITTILYVSGLVFVIGRSRRRTRSTVVIGEFRERPRCHKN